MNINKVGISSNIFHNSNEITARISELPNEFLAIEIEIEKELRKTYDNEYGKWLLIRKDLNLIKKSKNLYYSFHAPYLGQLTDISNLSEDIREQACQYLKKFIYEANYLGVSYFTLHPGYLLEKNDATLFPELFEKLCLSLKYLGAVASDYGIQLLLENTGNNRPRYIVIPADHYRYLYETYNVGITLDIVHYHSFHHNEELNYYNELKMLLP